MAKPSYVWGLDIGQCALKALRCTIEGDKVVAEAFDYIEYPKILSQPEADPEALVREALQQFLSRNEVKGDKIALAVPGQSGLAKFFKPPPVDVKRIPDIVQYEAKQQIPFPLEEVIWDFQKMAGGQEVDGFAIDTEVGLFAMKREQVYRALRPFDEAEVELDIVQLAPLAIYNFVAHDVLTDTDPDLFDPDDPPESIVVLSMGTDATDLVITNGFRVWQRSIPLGGNHFTKQLTKELKLTFAKAEHLKRNARQAEDPKKVFQAMRPIFNDMVTEVQRSIGYFQGIDRKAKIKGVVLLGNTVKLPGLQQYVAKNLGYEVIPFNALKKLSGPSVVSSPAFTDNVLAYAVSYGLCLQALGRGRLSTNLLPREIMTQRMIRAKKPWAIASVGALMLALAFNFVFNYSVWSEVQPDRSTGKVTWSAAEGKVSQVQSTSSNHESEHAAKKAQLSFLSGVGEEVVGAADRRLLWLEMLKALDSALPWTPNRDPRTYVDFKTVPLDQRHELYLQHVESEYFTDLQTWYGNSIVQEKYFELQRHLEAVRGDQSSAAPAGETAGPATEGATANGEPTSDIFGADAAGGDLTALAGTGPEGAGWVIELKGHHFFNSSLTAGGAVHVRNTLMRNLMEGVVALPVDKTGRTETFTMQELGISYPVLWDEGQPKPLRFPNPEFDGPAGPTGQGEAGTGPMASGFSGGFGPSGFGGATGMRQPTTTGRNGTQGEKKKIEDADGDPPYFDAKKYAFTVQFCWQPKRLSVRLEERAEKLRAQQEAAAAEAAAAGTLPQATGATNTTAPAGPAGAEPSTTVDQET